jgi:hypothetical protein
VPSTPAPGYHGTPVDFDRDPITGGHVNAPADAARDSAGYCKYVNCISQSEYDQEVAAGQAANAKAAAEEAQAKQDCATAGGTWEPTDWDAKRKAIGTCKTNSGNTGPGPVGIVPAPSATPPSSPVSGSGSLGGGLSQN